MTLTKNAAYDSVAYGVVQYKSSITQTRIDGSEYTVHRFQTPRGNMKYINDDELETFLRKEE